MESVDRSNVPARMIRYLTRFWTKILYSLSSLLDTSIESILGREDVRLIWTKAKKEVEKGVDLEAAGNTGKWGCILFSSHERENKPSRKSQSSP
jgi:hypothetical protein